jgi:glycerate 2-kinase
MALTFGLSLDGSDRILALAADTDGTGGGGRPGDPAGAFADSGTVTQARSGGLDPAAFLANNDSTGLFACPGDLLLTGPPHTNVTDFRAIFVDSA